MKRGSAEDFCLQALVRSITSGAAALLRGARGTQRGDRHPPAKLGFAKLHRAPPCHLLCHGDIAASPRPGSRTASL